jgi:hypothetical protein
MPNLVSVTIRGNDDTGPAFASVRAKGAALKASLKDVGRIGVGIDSSRLGTDLMALKARVQAVGIADIADVNVQPGRVMTQLQMIKRMVQQTKISDLLDFNINDAALSAKLASIKGMTERIPVTFDVGHLPDFSMTGISQNISDKFSIQGLAAAESQLALLDAALKDTDKDFHTFAQSGAGSDAVLTDLSGKFESLYLQMGAVNGEFRDISKDFSQGVAGNTTGDLGLLNTMLSELEGNIHSAGGDLAVTADAFRTLGNAGLGATAALGAADAKFADMAAMVTGARARLDGAALAMGHVGAAGDIAATGAGKVKSSAAGAADAVTKVNIVSGNWFRTLTNIGSAGVPLFAGALGALMPALHESDSGITKLAGHLINTTNGWHLMTEAVVETVAIWGPAAIAAAAFGLVATPTVKQLGVQLDNMNTAAKGTGKSFDSLKTSGQSLIAAVRPTVLEAFGIGLYAIQTHSGQLAPDLAKLGGAFDQLAAKAAVAFSSKAAGNFMAQASNDLLGLISSFTSIGQIIGSLMKAVPGYAEILLNFGNTFLHVGAVAVAGIEPILGAFLKLHGAILYGGLAGTLGAKVFSGLVSGAVSAAAGISNMAASILGDENLISVGAGKVLVALEGIGTGPVMAVGLAIGALAAIILYLKASKSAAQDFGDTLEKAVQGASVASLPSTLANAVAQASAKMAASQKQLTTAVSSSTAAQSQNVFAGRAGMIQNQATSEAVSKAATATDAYTASSSQLTQQQQNLTLNLAGIAAMYGTTLPGAISLASGAQVTSSQLLAGGAENWQVIAMQVRGYAKELQVITPGVGALNQALNALNVTQSQQVTDSQKLAQAYSSWIGIVTGGDSAFATFEQGQSTLSAAMSAGAAAAVKLTTTSGKLRQGQLLLSTSLEGTSVSALAARQAFDSQITAAVTLYGNLQTMAAVSGDTAAAQDSLARAGKDLVAQLLPMAAGSKAATAEVYSLAQIAGYKGVDSFSALSQWLGTTKGAEADLNKQTVALTISSANLTEAAKNLSAAMSTGLNSAMAQVTLTETGGLKPMENLYGAIKQTGANSGATRTAALALGNQLLTLTGSTSKAHDEFDAFATNSLGLTTKQANTLWSEISGKLNPTIANSGTQALIAAGKIDSGFVASLQKIGFDSPGVNRGITNFSNAILSSGDSSDSTRGARANLIGDLVKAGLSAGTAQGLVQNLQGQIDALKGKTVKVGVVASGTGTFTIATTGAANTRFQEMIHLTTAGTGYAAGGRLPGFGGGDRNLALLEDGEAVIDKHRTRQYAPFLSAIGVPGFSGGGLIGTENAVAAGLSTASSQGLDAATMLGMNAAIAFAERQLTQQANNSDSAAHAGPGGGSALANMRLAQSLYPAYSSGPVWDAWNNVAMAESGWNQFADNPSSGAYGIAQALPATKYPFAGQAAGGSNPTAQETWMWDYMAQSYGGPIGAWQHEQAYHWYDNGGWLEPGLTMAYNGTGKPERVTPPPGAGQVAAQLASGQIHITLELGPSFKAAGLAEQQLKDIRYTVRTQGGGNVQKAFGKN